MNRAARRRQERAQRRPAQVEPIWIDVCRDQDDEPVLLAELDERTAGALMDEVPSGADLRSVVGWLEDHGIRYALTHEGWHEFEAYHLN